MAPLDVVARQHQVLVLSLELPTGFGERAELVLVQAAGTWNIINQHQ
jgi:hypothetical protein